MGSIGSPFSLLEELCGCDGVDGATFEWPFIGACSLYLRNSLSPCLQQAGQSVIPQHEWSKIYRSPTRSIVIPVSELSSLSSPPWGLFERTTEVESVVLGSLSRIYGQSRFPASVKCTRLGHTIVMSKHTGGSSDVN